MDENCAPVEKQLVKNRSTWLIGLVFMILLLAAMWMDTNYVGASNVGKITTIAVIPTDEKIKPATKAGTAQSTSQYIQEEIPAYTTEISDDEIVTIPQSGPAATRIAEIKQQKYSRRVILAVTPETTREANANSSISPGQTPTGNSDLFGPVIVQLVNGDFEDGPMNGWISYSNRNYDIIYPAHALPAPIQSHQGAWVAWIGGAYNEEAYIQQQITIPDYAPFLTYWVWIDSVDTCGSDYAALLINDIEIERFQFCLAGNTLGWEQHISDVGAYAGQSVTLKFLSRSNASLPSSLYLDDVVLSSEETPTNPLYLPFMWKIRN